MTLIDFPFPLLAVEVGEAGASPMAGCERRQHGHGIRVHNLLRASNRFRAVYVRSHVHVLRMRTKAMENRWGSLSVVSRRHSGCDSHIQIVDGERESARASGRDEASVSLSSGSADTKKKKRLHSSHFSEQTFKRRIWNIPQLKCFIVFYKSRLSYPM